MRTSQMNALLAALLLAGSAMAQTGAAPAPAAAASAPAGPSVRPELGKPLLEAQTLINEKKYATAKEKLQLANAFADKTPYENYLITLLSLNAAVREDDAVNADLLLTQLMVLNRTGEWLKPSEALDSVYNVVATSFNAKKYDLAAKWSNAYVEQGGTNTVVKLIRARSYLFAGDSKRSIALVEDEIAAAVKTGQAPALNYLEILLQAQGQLKDTAGTTRAVELLVNYYPKKEYWQSLVNRLWARPDLSPALHLDVFRLGFYVGALSETTDYSEYIDFAQRGGYSAEALTAFDQGVEVGLMGTGANAEVHKKLRLKLAAEVEQDKKTAVADAANALKKPNGVAMVNLGFSLVGQGQFDKGIELLEKGIAKGLPKRADDAKLHLAIAHVLAGQPDKAKLVFATVFGKEGLDDLVRYWLLAMRKP